MENTSGNSSQNFSPTPDRVQQFMELYARHHAALFRYVRSLVFTNADAEDVIQEVSQALWKDFAKFESGTDFAAWARKTAYFRVQEHRRAMGRKPAALPDDVLEKVALEAESMSGWEEDRHAALNACLDKLRNKDRELIALKYARNMQIVSIAEQVGRPVHSLYQSLSRIRQNLLACIQKQLGQNSSR